MDFINCYEDVSRAKAYATLEFANTYYLAYRELPRSYLERLYNIQRWTVFPRGGQFAPAEEPAAVAGDLIAFFRGLS